MNLTRRTFLASPLLGFLPRLPPLAGDRALLVLWLDGGMSHLDTFDGKPEAPIAIRGDLRSVESALPGTFVSEHLPQIGARMNRCVLMRSLTHGEGNHDRGAHLLLTGYRPSPVLVHPSLGSVLAGDAQNPLPPYVTIPSTPQYGGAGFLGAAREPFATEGIGAEGLAPAPAHARGLELLQEKDRLDGGPHSASEAARDAFHARARRLLLDGKARSLFDLADEKPAVRARYGNHALGQNLLRARRLALGGARCVLVRDVGWDHHQQIKTGLTYGFPPKLTALDEGLSALLDDEVVSERVLVCVMSEFGRTPRLNPSGGRDHWPRAQSVLLFGAGLARGVAIGTTDARGEEPKDRPISVSELHATIFAALGVNLPPLRSPDGRPVRLVDADAEPLAEALA